MSSEIVQITLVPNGPARVQSGKYEFKLADGSTLVKEAPFSLCRCGTSKRKPFCDGSHKECDFKD